MTPGTGPGSDFLPLLRANLTKLVATNSLQAFYPPQRIEEVLARLVQVDFRCESCLTSDNHARCRHVECAQRRFSDAGLRPHLAMQHIDVRRQQAMLLLHTSFRSFYVQMI